MKPVKMCIAAVALLSVIVGSMAGVVSILDNEYLKHAHHYLALDELTGSLNRVLYILTVLGILAATVLTGLRYSSRNVLQLAVLSAAVVGFYFLIDTLDLHYRADLVWNEMSLFEKAGVILLLLLIVDLTVGKKWSGLFLEGVAWRAVAAVLAVSALLNVASWLWFNRLQKNLSDRPNVLILVVDALRADHVGCLGYERNTTPFIDSLAADGVLFTQAVSNSNATRSTVPSIFTLVYPSVHGILGRDGPVLSPRFVTLAEILKNQGYATQAYMPNGPLRRVFNFDQGFDIYDDRIMGFGKLERYDSALPINESILSWIDGHGNKRFFMYVHYVEPHSPYHPPPAYDKMFYGTDAANHVRTIEDKELERLKRSSGKTFPLEINDLNFYLAQYDAEIRYADDQIKHLLDNLQQRGLLENTAIFLTADHGEAFLEHGHWMHATSPLYEEVIHVPLIAKLPGSERKGLRFDGPVHTFDISATILDLLDLTPDFTVQAKSLLPIINGEVERQWEYTFVESLNERVLRNREWKFIIRGPLRRGRKALKTRQELYNLLEDPSESNNLVRQEPEKAKELRAKLLAVAQLNSRLSKGNVVETKTLDKETIDQLRSLGYLQ